MGDPHTHTYIIHTQSNVHMLGCELELNIRTKERNANKKKLILIQTKWWTIDKEGRSAELQCLI